MKRFLLPVIVALLLVSPTLGQSVDDSPVLARWTDGELTENEFVEILDHDGEALTRGGEYLEKQLCKAVFLALYGRRAIQAGIDRSSEYLDAVADWQTGRLERAYLEEHRPSASEVVSSDEVESFVEANRERLYTSIGTADISVLFVRCGDETVAREACWQRLEEYRRQVGLGVRTMADAMAEERPRSGSANGSFTQVPLKSLAEELRAAVLLTPVGEYSQFIETPSGLFWLRVDARIDAVKIEFESAAGHARALLAKQAIEEWRSDEVDRLRDDLELLDDVPDAEVLATAATTEGLDRDAAFIEAQRTFSRWKLADLAFFQDKAILPDDDEVVARLADPAADARFRRFDLEWFHVTVGEDRHAALATVERLTALLDPESDPEETGSFVEMHDDVSRYMLHDVTLDQVRGLNSELAKDLPDTPDGGWTGPFALSRGGTIAGELVDLESDQELPPGIVVVVRRSSRLLSVEEARDEVNRAHRNQITSSDRFLETFGERWGLELLIEDGGEGPTESEGAGEPVEEETP